MTLLGFSVLMGRERRFPMADKKVTIYRRADNGQITTEKYAKAHPNTTEKERRDAPKPKRSK